MPKMLLAIDIGNTDTVFGVYRDDRLVRSWRLSTHRDRTVDEYGILLRNLFAIEELDGASIRNVIISSVVPPLDATLEEMSRHYFSVTPVFVSAENAGIPILYEDPQEVGADRIVDAVAVLERYGSPAIIVDLGTATTFDAISRAGEYLGGLIAPGIRVSADALISQAARLSRVDIRRPEQLIGRTTETSLQSGFFWGYVSLVDGIIERMRGELGDDTRVIATGGMTRFIQDESRWITEFDPDLTLEGLRLVAKRLGAV